MNKIKPSMIKRVLQLTQSTPSVTILYKFGINELSLEIELEKMILNFLKQGLSIPYLVVMQTPCSLFFFLYKHTALLRTDSHGCSVYRHLFTAICPRFLQLLPKLRIVQKCFESSLHIKKCEKCIM